MIPNNLYIIILFGINIKSCIVYIYYLKASKAMVGRPSLNDPSS